MPLTAGLSDDFQAKKRKYDDNVNNVAVDDNEIVESKEERKRRKKEKKEAKRKAEAEAEAEAEQENENQNSAETDNNVTVDDNTVDEAEAKRLRKAAKKEKKAREAAEQQQNNNKNNNDNSTSSNGSAADIAEVASYRAEKEMSLAGEGSESNIFYPIRDFASSGFSKQLLQCTNNFSSPTAIQAQTWPVIINKRDVIAIAETGSGKTLGFVLPACAHILKSMAVTVADSNSKGRLPKVLILCPTRELAMQTAEVATTAAATVKLKTTCIYGGVDKRQQSYTISQGIDIMVATPGRLLNLIEEKTCNISQVDYLVLDEADRMLDLGFEPDIRAVVKLIVASPKRQTCMFSATWPEPIQKLAKDFLHNPIQIVIGNVTTELTTNSRIKQHVEVLDEFDRDRRLLQLLQQHHTTRNPTTKILVFVLYKKEVDKVERLLLNKGYHAKGISSDKSQHDRSTAMEEFKSGKLMLMVATDVAARGLDIDSINVVINYSFPLTIEDYVHRIGRTGRGGKTGIAYTFFTKNDKGLSGELINVLTDAKEDVPADLMKFGTAVKRKKHSMFGDFYRDDSRPMKAAVKVTFD